MKMVPTYLSHSYRAADRLLNETICEFFWKKSLGFTVDPKSGRPTIAQLEVMMRRSAAFVAVAPYRADVEYYRTSPFIVYECGLAQQARRPMLVFAETGVSGQAFASDNVIAFDRATINETLAEDARSSVRVLLERSRPDAGMARRTVGTVGLVLPATPAYRAVLPLIIDVLKRAGYQPEIVDTAPDDHWRLLIDLERHDFVVTDIGPRGKTGWLYPLMYGRFIPTVKLVHTPGRRSAVPALSAIVRSRALKAAGSTWMHRVNWCDSAWRYGADGLPPGKMVIAKVPMTPKRRPSARCNYHRVRGSPRPSMNRTCCHRLGWCR